MKLRFAVILGFLNSHGTNAAFCAPSVGMNNGIGQQQNNFPSLSQSRCFHNSPCQFSATNQRSSTPMLQSSQKITSRRKSRADSAAGSSTSLNAFSPRTTHESNFLMDDFRTADGEIIDPYKVLKVGRRAERKEIRECYLKLSKKYHPDGVRFREILPGKW